MITIILHGANGVMGQIVSGIAKESSEVKIVAGVDINCKENGWYPVYPSFEGVDVKADVVVDFSVAPAADALLDFCLRTKTPVVLCTTGLSEAQIKKVEEVSQEVPLLRSANMSLGINLLLSLLKDAAVVLANAGFDIEIVEKHHNRKKDAPSGTALALADSINEVFGGSYTYTFDRSQRRQKRDEKEIGISAVRGGTIVGEHDVIFAGTDEIVTISHAAHSRAVFAKGALEAASFLIGRKPGLYSMADVIAARKG